MVTRKPDIIELQSWEEFPERLQAELERRGHRRFVALRNFELTTADINGGPDVDRLDVAVTTGTDRDKHSPFWNESEHDFDHDAHSAGKGPADIVYAYTVDASQSPYNVRSFGTGDLDIPATISAVDLTTGLDEESGILVYDRAQLNHVAPNEYWFRTDPLEALMMVFRLAP